MSFQARIESTLPPLSWQEKVKREIRCSVNRYVVAMVMALAIAVIGLFYCNNPSICYSLFAISGILSTAFSI